MKPYDRAVPFFFHLQKQIIDISCREKGYGDAIRQMNKPNKSM